MAFGENVAAYFFEPEPNWEYLLVISDEYTRYPEFEIVSSKYAKVVIPTLNKVFSVFNIQQIIKLWSSLEWWEN